MSSNRQVLANLLGELLERSIKSGRRATGKLSIAVKPRSDKILLAVDFPAPEIPEINTSEER